VYINFLIVGHTHNSLDQNYSILSSARKATSFISSLEALMSCFQYAHDLPRDQPLYQHEILVEYDYDKWLAPYLADYHYYQTPFVFKIDKCLGRARLQYSMLSSQPLLPAAPTGMAAATSAVDFEIEPMADVGGVDSYVLFYYLISDNSLSLYLTLSFFLLSSSLLFLFFSPLSHTHTLSISLTLSLCISLPLSFS
jgi:hypothetical protein